MNIDRANDSLHFVQFIEELLQLVFDVNFNILFIVHEAHCELVRKCSSIKQSIAKKTFN